MSNSAALPLIEHDAERMVVPAKYAIRQLFRDIAGVNNIKSDDNKWLLESCRNAAAKRLSLDRLEEYVRHGVLSPSVSDVRRYDHRRLGKPSMKLVLGRLVADVLVEQNGVEWGEEHKVLILRQEVLEARKDYLEQRSALTGLAVTQHALERLYQREDCCQSDILQRVRDDVGCAAGALAFATAAGISLRGRLCEPGASTVLPIGNGLMVVRNMLVATTKGTSHTTRMIACKNGFLSTIVDHRRKRLVSLPPVMGLEVQGHVVSMGITYLSEDLLHIEQKAYAAMFREEMEKHDIQAISEQMNQVRLSHEKLPELPQINVSDRLHYLLSQVMVPKPGLAPVYAIGWDGWSDPRTNKKQKD